MKPNIPRMRKELAWMEEQQDKPKHEKTHKQTEWIYSPEINSALADEGVWCGVGTFDCNTKSCLCGHMAIEDGAEIIVHRGVYGERSVTFDGLDPTTYGAEALGIDWSDASELFHPHVTVARQREIMEQLAGEPL